MLVEINGSFAGGPGQLGDYYVQVPAAQVTTPPTMDQLIVLVTGGSCEIEGKFRGKWQEAAHRAGTVAMTAPGEEVTLPFATVHRVEGDKVVLWKDYWSYDHLLDHAPEGWKERLFSSDLWWLTDVTGSPSL